MLRRSRFQPAIAITAVVVIGTMLGPLASVQPSGASTPSLCQKVSAAEVSATLGLKATSSSSQVNGSVTVCWYKVGANSQAVYVRTQTGDDTAGFNADQKMAKTQGENPKADLKFKPYRAFSTTLGSAAYGGVTYSVTVLKKTTELSLGGVKTSLTSVESLAKKVLAIL